MSQKYKYIGALLMLLSFSLSAQNEINEDHETIQINIDYKINQAQQDIESSNYFEAQKKTGNSFSTC